MLEVLTVWIPVLVLHIKNINRDVEKNIGEWRIYFTRDALVQRVPFYRGEAPFTMIYHDMALIDRSEPSP